MGMWRSICALTAVAMVAVMLAPPPTLLVSFWILYDPCTEKPCDVVVHEAVRTLPQTELEIARTIFKRAPGIDLIEVRRVDLTERAAAQGAQDPIGCYDRDSTATTLAQLARLTGPTDPNQFHVYYVRDPGAYGVWCGVYDPAGADMILIGSLHQPRTLAHEIGHALLNSGDHVEEGIEGFSAENLRDNLMRGDYLGEHLTIGQMLRANFNPGSAVNRHHPGSTGWDGKRRGSSND